MKIETKTTSTPINIQPENNSQLHNAAGADVSPSTKVEDRDS